MKKIKLTFILSILTITSFSQSKNMSVAFKLGLTNAVVVGEKGFQVSPQFNYHFFKEKRANLTIGVFYATYNTAIEYRLGFQNPDGSFQFEKESISISDRYFGLSLSSQIRLSEPTHKVIFFIQPSLNFNREIVDNQNQTFGGGKIDPENIFYAGIASGLEYKNRIQFSLYYEYALKEKQYLPMATPNYSYGFSLGYLFNMSFKKKEISE